MGWHRCCGLFSLLISAALSTGCQSEQPTASCANPTLELQGDQRIPGNTLIRWQPPHCPMVIETWRNGTDCRKLGITDRSGRDHTKSGPCDGDGRQDIGVPSGTVTIDDIRRGQKGLTEIKLWVPNAPRPEQFKSVFVVVE